ncbi:hypothetical protein SmJEL517_g02618 [Synchytrium microbalum]|uniref:G-protein coupled receptors family 1 profile domain-containing protein n=1 Tax=Synchytrium microbalum TaxID=1806994 RepID=A0A507BZZ0_9FUNG|nr:uncharacterized protein SmJEL517_g02618 [Synchytrium microbalum]TPX34840.1 hypothetical protein SmJEL517_g02618 [Synchytrium microbalum]
MGFTDGQLLSLNVSVQVTAILSIIGALTVLGHIWYDVKRRQQNRITAFLALSDLLTALSTVFAQYPISGFLSSGYPTVSSTACVAQAFGIQTFFIASACWQVVALYLFVLQQTGF